MESCRNKLGIEIRLKKVPPFLSALSICPRSLYVLFAEDGVKTPLIKEHVLKKKGKTNWRIKQSPRDLNSSLIQEMIRSVAVKNGTGTKVGEGIPDRTTLL